MPAHFQNRWGAHAELIGYVGIPLSGSMETRPEYRVEKELADQQYALHLFDIAFKAANPDPSSNLRYRLVQRSLQSMKKPKHPSLLLPRPRNPRISPDQRGADRSTRPRRGQLAHRPGIR